MTLELLLTGLLAAAQSQAAPPSSPKPLTPGDRVVATDDRQSIRGRVAEITADVLIVEGDSKPVRIPLASVQQIDRVGDSVLNGTAIGAGLGGGASLALMAKVCSNSNCADTSANLDPRLVLAGTLIGAGVGALVDAVIDRRTTVYRAGQSRPLPTTLPPVMTTAGAKRVMAFGRFGWARLTDDEGTLGDGATVGIGAIVPITPRLGLQVAYDRHDHRRNFEPVGPPGSATPGGGFSGTEQLVTAKALFFFRPDETVRPYAGIGVGYLHSERMSQFPTFVSNPRGFPTPGPPEIFRYESRGAGLGFATGVDVRLTNRLSVLGDLTLDLNDPDALGSTRLTVGAGWRF